MAGQDRRVQALFFQSPRPGLNRRPRTYQVRALPSELQGQNSSTTLAPHSLYNRAKMLTNETCF